MPVKDDGTLPRRIQRPIQTFQTQLQPDEFRDELHNSGRTWLLGSLKEDVALLQSRLSRVQIFQLFQERVTVKSLCLRWHGIQFIRELKLHLNGRRQAQGLGLDVGDLTQAIFARLGMTRTSLVFQNGVETNVADGWNDLGQPQPHDKGSKVRVAGSMNTTISDLSKFSAALVRGDGLTAASRAEMTRPTLHIPTAHLFPLFLPDAALSDQRKDLYTGLGVIVFDGPQGHGFYKGGHDGQTANTMVCLDASQRCVLILSNDVRSEAAFADLVKFILGDTGVPFDWEYGDNAGKS